jgi:hypothetical protein
MKFYSRNLPSTCMRPPAFQPWMSISLLIDDLKHPLLRLCSRLLEFQPLHMARNILRIRKKIYLPIWASRTHIATCLMYVLLPPMLGPVIICKFDLFRTILQSLLMHVAGSWMWIRGCLLSIIYTCSFSSWQIIGLTYWCVDETSAKAHNTSSWEINAETVSSRG